MRRIFIYFLTVLISLTAFANVTLAESENYSLSEVEQHNSPTDCWMIFEDSIYDITEYVIRHDRFMDIRSWCGRDMTTDFMTKAGEGRDHKPATYEMLKEYKIGEVKAELIPTNEGSTPERQQPYNFIIPFATTLVLYIFSYLVATKGWFNKALPIPKMNLFWNTIMALSLIPSVIFGFILIFQYGIPALAAIKFDFLYWHVEGSIVFGTAVFCHFIQRFKQYLVPFRLFKKKPVGTVNA